MADESQEYLAAGIQQKSDEQFPTTTKLPNFHHLHHDHHHKSNKLIVYVLSAVVLQAIVFLAFASIILRVKSPTVELTSASVRNLVHTTNNDTSLNSLNMTMFARVNLDNENFGRFNYENFEAVILYGNSTIGGGDIGGGRVKSRGESVRDLTVEVRAENLNSTSSSGDLVELISYAEVKGRVRIMKMVNKFKMVKLNCTMNLNLSSQAIRNLRCR
ncbi:hypothetical protein LguiA_015719 [Lonicera macranthoides]